MPHARPQPQAAYFFLPRILNIFVPQTEHVPVIARRSTPPLPFMATSLGLSMVRFSRHFTQYPSFMHPVYTMGGRKANEKKRHAKHAPQFYRSTDSE